MIDGRLPRPICHTAITVTSMRHQRLNSATRPTIASVMSCADNLHALKRGKYSAMKGNEAVGLVAPQAVHRHLGLGREF